VKQNVNIEKFKNKVIKQDVIDYLESLPDRSIDSIITDPPYYRVVADKWDNQWLTIDDYLEWCEKWIEICSRKVKRSGTFMVFGFSYQLARLLPIFEKYNFKFRQQVVIDKGLKSVAGRTSNKLKQFPTATEHMYYFYYDCSLEIAEMMEEKRKEKNLKPYEINGMLGKATTGGGFWVSCFSLNKAKVSGITYPTKEDWIKLQEIFEDIPEYDDIVYSFNIIKGLTDVWSDIDFYEVKKKDKFHPTQKPLNLMDRVVQSITKENAIVLDPFMGSGSTAISCITNNRNFVGCEKDDYYFEKLNERIKQHYNVLKENKLKIEPETLVTFND